MTDLVAKVDYSAKALALTILCATRSNETFNATWSEFDLDNAIWTIPADRMKMGKEHRVPLSTVALTILQNTPRIESNPFVFPGAKRERPLSNMAMLEMLRGMRKLNRMPITGRTIYLSAEDDRAELHRRLAMIAQSHSASTSDLAGITIADLAGKDALLASIGRKDATVRPSLLFELINAKIASIAPRLVVINTLADAYPGNETDRAQARQFIGLMRRIAITHHCSVLLLAHPSLTGINTGTGASGSTAWNNSVRSRLYFERIKDTNGHEYNPDARRLKVMKSNYGRTGQEITVAWKDGIFIAEQDGGATDTNARAERIFINVIEQLAAQGRYLNDLHAPKTLSEMQGSEGLTKKTIKDAMERLFVNGKIGKREIIENRRPRSVIMILR